MGKIFKTCLEIVETLVHRGLFYTKSKKVLLFRFLTNRIKLLPQGFYSQSGQDELIEEILLGRNDIDIKKIVIIDIGSNHPIVLNNSYYFENKYKAGVYSIEPNPSFESVYEKYGRNFINSAVGSTEKIMNLFVPNRSLDRIYTDNVHATLLQDELPGGSDTDVDIIEVNVEPLSKLVPPGLYNVLFIDVEGFELDVLKGIDFTLFQFDIICIENNSKFRDRKVIRNVMNKYGYYLKIRIHGLDDIFVRK